MSSPKHRFPKVDFILSINSIISQSITVRSGLFKSLRKLLKSDGHVLSLRKLLKSDGHVLMVVPSLESSLFSDFKHIEWNLKNGQRPSNADQAGFGRHKSNQIHQGIRKLGGTATKLYLKEELISIFSSLGFKIKEISKIEYAWTTEFDNPPRWMKDLYPWDWFLLAKKI